MTVTEVMFIAIPAWFALVGGIFALVFGWDVMQMFKRVKYAHDIDEEKDLRHDRHEGEWQDSYATSERVRTGERELVHH